MKAGRPAFLKKGSKKLLLVGVRGPFRNGQRAPGSKSLLLLFSKKEDLSCFS
jgi:hypothetical protein